MSFFVSFVIAQIRTISPAKNLRKCSNTFPQEFSSKKIALRLFPRILFQENCNLKPSNSTASVFQD